jgi:hypothetical protein
MQEEDAMRPYHVIFKWGGRLAALGFLAVLCGSALYAQQAGDGQTVDKATLQLLLTRIDQLESRVRQLEAERPQTGAANSAPAPASQTAMTAETTPPPAGPATLASGAPRMPPAAAPESDQPPSDNGMADRMDLSKTLLRIRGFGDVDLHGDTGKGDTTSFSLGQLDLFVTSDVSENFRFLSEIVFEGGPEDVYGHAEGTENQITTDVERYLLQYSYNDYFNISAGKGHLAIGYYNTAYHHSAWMQTTTRRPFIYDFEDRGGILPIHMIGVSAAGRLPAGQLGLHYVAELGNGRASRDPLNQVPVQNVVDDKTHKAFNLALFAKPEAVPGFQAGFSFYRDVLAPDKAPRIGESILAGHAILIRPKYEWLSEAVLDRLTPIGSSTTNTPGFYSQVSEQWGLYRPYFRYEYVNVSQRNPVFPDVGLRHGPVMGLRFDASEFVALKFQYDYLLMRNRPNINSLTLQLGFTF